MGCEKLTYQRDTSLGQNSQIRQSWKAFCVGLKPSDGEHRSIGAASRALGKNWTSWSAAGHLARAILCNFYFLAYAAY